MNQSYLKLCSLCILSLATGHASPAFAQMMDYGSLEAAFGEPVTTSATGTPLRESTSPANITIVTADEIRQSGSRNIPEILARVPGLDILQSSNNVFDVGVRGYQQPFQPRLLVLLDGRQVFIDDYSRTIWDNIPVNVDDIRQIEVVKGTNSALYGSNAAGGVINIVTYSPLYDDSNVASLTVGTQHTLTGDGTATVRGEWGGSKTSIGGLQAKQFNTPRIDNYDSPRQDPYHGYIANSSVFKFSPKLSFTTQANYSSSGGTTDDIINNGQSAGQTTITYSAGAGFVWDSPIGTITNTNYLNHSNVNLNESKTDEGLPYGLRTNLFSSQIQDQLKIDPNNTVRVAFEYRYKDFRNSGVQETPQTPSLAENTFSASGFWLHKFNHDLSWSNSLRVDHQTLEETGVLAPGLLYGFQDYNQNITAYTGNSDIVYKPTDEDSFRLGYGRGVQMPSFLQYGFTQFYTFGFENITDAHTFSVPADYEGNPYLKPTYVQDYSFDYDRKVDPIFSHIKFSAFYELNQDMVTSFALSDQVFTLSSVDYDIYTPANVGNSRAWGGELEIKGSHPSGFRWDASYSYARVFDSELVKSNLDYEGSSPRHHFRMLLGYTTGPWELDTFGQLQTSTNMLRGTQVSFQPTYTSGYSTFSARVGYKIDDNFTLAVSGTHLGASTLRVSPYPDVQRQVFVTLTGKL